MPALGFFRKALFGGGRFLGGLIDTRFDLREFSAELIDLNFEFADPPAFIRNG